jgi:hypothetical protein
VSASAPTICIQSGEETSKAIRRIALMIIDDAVDRLRSEDETALSERVHEARKRFKEIRAVLRLVAGASGIQGQAARLLFRDAGRQLALGRDADALVETFDEMKTHFGPAWRIRRFSKIRKELQRRSEAEIPQPIREIAARIEAIRPQFAAWDLAPSSFELLEPGLRDGYQRARKGMRRALAVRRNEAFHEWRKRVKEHWVQSRVIENIWPPIMKPQNASLHDLSRILGRHHDLAMLTDLIDREPSAFGSARYVRSFQKFVEGRMAELENDAQSLGSKLFSDEADVWVRRIHDYWDSSDLSKHVILSEVDGRV